MASEFSSVYGKITFVESGFFVFETVKWFMVLCWVIVIPLLLIGMVKALKGDTTHKNLALLYLVSLVLISSVSFQVRHTLQFIVLNPIFVNMGYDHIQRSYKAMQLNKFLRWLVLVIIVSYNFYRVL